MKRKLIFSNNPLQILVRFSAAIFLTFSILACNENEDVVLLKKENGAYIINEGAWGSSNSSVSFYSFEGDSVTGELFKKANGTSAILGDVLQDLHITEDKIFMVLNASNYIQVVNRDDFKWVKTIEGLNNPRYLKLYENILYLTQWGDWGETGQVVLINPETFEIIKSIEVNTGPEGIMAHNGLIWVANSGGYATDNTISVIDPISSSVINTIEVPDGPKHFVVDKSGDIWAVCYGSELYDANWNIIGETASNLIKISTVTQEVINTLKISDNHHPSHININPAGNVIYISDSRGIFAYHINDMEEFPSEPFIPGYFYGFNTNPVNGDIYAGQATSFTQPGKVIVYNGNNGDLVRTLDQNIGIGPSKIVFKY